MFFFKLLYLVMIFPSSVKNFGHLYSIDMYLIEACPENEMMESPMRNVKFQHLNRTHKSLSFDVTTRSPMDKTVGVTVTADKWGPQGWVRFPYITYTPNVCKTAKLFIGDLYKELLGGLGVEHPDRCPVPPGNYSMRNFIIDYSKRKMPFWEGRFKLTATLLKNNKDKFFCMLLQVLVTDIV